MLDIKREFFFLKELLPTIKFKILFFGSAIGSNLRVGGRGTFSCGGRAEIGNDVFIGDRSTIYVYGSKERKLLIGAAFSATTGLIITCGVGVHIGNHVLFGNNVHIHDINHGINPERGYYSEQPYSGAAIVIGDGVWCGDNVVILPGVQIGEYSIIGANAVVTRDIPAYVIAVGVPARPIKQYDKDMKEWVAL